MTDNPNETRAAWLASLKEGDDVAVFSRPYMCHVSRTFTSHIERIVRVTPKRIQLQCERVIERETGRAVSRLDNYFIEPSHRHVERKPAPDTAPVPYLDEMRDVENAVVNTANDLCSDPSAANLSRLTRALAVLKGEE